MNRRRLALGLDLSTQSLSCVVLDVQQQAIVFEHSLDYLADPRLAGFGVRGEDYILPPASEGEAEQPPEMYFAALDAMLGDLKEAGVSTGDVAVINSSGQQHGHVYLGWDAASLFSHLWEECEGSDLLHRLDGCLSYPRAPIWMTSNTRAEADFIRERAGGSRNLIHITGSDVPLRFTAAVIRRVGQQFPESYRETATVQLLSGLLPAILSGNPRVPIDVGNACGTSLMDYQGMEWSSLLLDATADGLSGGEAALRDKLPPLCSPDAIVGHIASYFVRKYGFHPGCRIVAGSGDNPQSKVLVAGDLLSVGSSIVNMVSTHATARDWRGYANAMYDGVGRPFMFGCRTNGALVWDRIRAEYHLKKNEYRPAENALESVPIGGSLVFWQPRNESFPPSASFDLVRIGDLEPDLGRDYAGLSESTLASAYYHSRQYASATDEPLRVTGGATLSHGIMRRVAAIWDRPVVPVREGGAALGAAVAGVCALQRIEGSSADWKQLGESLLGAGAALHPRRDDVAAIHGVGGYLERFAREEAKLICRRVGPSE